MAVSRFCTHALVLLVAGPAALAVNVSLVTVGNPENAGDTRYPNNGVSSFGSVGYTYGIGKFDVTAGQYAAFLNAVAATDTYGLYNPLMDYDADPDYMGCNIKQSGSSGSYTYSVDSDWANRPVNYVSWGDAARFANWLSHGQPTGAQSASTTEDGSYALNGATTNTALQAVRRKLNATWVIPTENEWYKAAYYDPNKPGGPGYWDYPTRSDTAPSNVLSATGTNNANYWSYDYTIHAGTYAIGAPYYRTEVGAYASSTSAYGTFDQGGNVWQWNEAVITTGSNGPSRGLRGGNFNDDDHALLASLSRNYAYPPSVENGTFGFRLAYVPEPATLTLLALVGLLTVRRRR